MTKFSDSSKCICKPTLKCNALIIQYKSVCDKVWKMKCSKKNPKSINNQIELLAERCYNLRRKFMFDCCNFACRDKGHTGAIDKMFKKLNECKALREKSEPKKRKSKKDSGIKSVRRAKSLSIAYPNDNIKHYIRYSLK